MSGEATRPSLLSRVRDPSDVQARYEFEARYGELLVRYARACGLQHADAEDVRQMVLLKLSRSLRDFEYRPERGRFRDYLGRVVGREGLDQKLESLLRRRIRDPANRRFADHLARYADQIFTFLEHPGMEATNHWAERAIRPAVVNRKVFGGNRTEAGARAQEILCSVLRTCQQRGGKGFEYLAHVLRVPFCLGRPMSPIALPAS